MAALTGVALNRVRKELQMLFEDPPPGISAWFKEDDSREIEAGTSTHTETSRNFPFTVDLMLPTLHVLLSG
jgi:ubiquitin-protein ligase